MKVSVVIPAKNEAKYIKNTLVSLKKQSIKNYEIIVVDNNSKDNTAAIAKKYAKVVFEKEPGVGRARNKGAENATGEIIVFIDADTIPANKNFLKEYVTAFKDKKVVAATGPVFPFTKKLSYRIGYWIVSDLMVRASILLHRPIIMGMNFAVRKSTFDKEKFNENFVTFEDWDLSLRLRKHGKIKFVSGAKVFSSERRVKKWGLIKFIKFHTSNVFRYMLKKEPHNEYEDIR